MGVQYQVASENLFKWILYMENMARDSPCYTTASDTPTPCNLHFLTYFSARAVNDLG